MGAEPKLIDLAEKSFKLVLEADVHQDNKASRILSAMAFLTAAAASIFAKVYSPRSSTAEILQPYATFFGIDWSLIGFLGYIILVLIGASFYLAAMGLIINISLLQVRRIEGQNSPKSLIFFKAITELSLVQWREYWKLKTPSELQTEMGDNYIFETYLLAKKTQTKIYFMSLGSILFKLALLFFAFLISSFFSYDIEIIRIIIAFSGVLLTFTLLVEGESRSPIGLHAGNLLLLIAVWIMIGLFLFLIKLA